MLIHASADLPGDNDPALDRGPVLVRVDLRISGDVPGGPGRLTLPGDGRRVAFVQARAERITDGARLVGRMWRRRVQDAEGRPWLIGVSGLKGDRAHDSADTVRELAAVPGALDTCRLLAARLMAACIVGGVRGPASCDSDDTGYSYSLGRVRGQDPALPPGEPSTPRPVTPEDVAAAAAALPSLDAALAAAEGDDTDAEIVALSAGAELRARLPGLRAAVTPPTEIIGEDNAEVQAEDGPRADLPGLG